MNEQQLATLLKQMVRGGVKNIFSTLGALYCSQVYLSFQFYVGPLRLR